MKLHSVDSFLVGTEWLATAQHCGENENMLHGTLVMVATVAMTMTMVIVAVVATVT